MPDNLELDNSIEIPPDSRSPEPLTNTNDVWKPTTAAEFRQKQTDRLARVLFAVCVASILSLLTARFILSAIGVSFDSNTYDSIFEKVMYITTALLGYLFGKGSSESK